MAYSELVKNFNRIREYMREFYVYGFKAGMSIRGKAPALMMTSGAVWRAGLEIICGFGDVGAAKMCSFP